MSCIKGPVKQTSDTTDNNQLMANNSLVTSENSSNPIYDDMKNKNDTNQNQSIYNDQVNKANDTTKSLNNVLIPKIDNRMKQPKTEQDKIQKIKINNFKSDSI